jgi:Domain of unknown function (DUF4440)
MRHAKLELRIGTTAEHSVLEVYPMDGCGAVEMGVHRFHHLGPENREPPGEAKFVHLWHNTDGAWKISRVISYDHHSLAK